MSALDKYLVVQVREPATVATVATVRPLSGTIEPSCSRSSNCSSPPNPETEVEQPGAPPPADKLAPTWGAETAALIRWFQTTTPPAAPFELMPSVTIVQPDWWWLSIASDIASGPRVGRGQTGALAGDLAKLYGLFGQASDGSTA